ncbi:alpha/beta hydrolase [Kocuria aegyptia]|uniref:AB hydrolase-1 domain-containing protein n=1 Tax=Kocuria aegyptia TaxID=330943 RepID=A0ABP4WED7_9MICC
MAALRRLTAAATTALAVGALLRRTHLWSNGKPIPVVGADGRPATGGLTEKLYLDVNGVRQGMFLRSRDAAQPVLLYLHGGMPEYFLTERYPTVLEHHFTVAWWEQRGTGLSYSPDIPPETITAEQLIADTLTVTDYLRRRFGTDRIYLLAHSGGTFFGLQAAARAPERYHAYIGMAQMADQLQSELLAYQYMLRRFEERGDQRMARRLRNAPVTVTGGTPRAYLAIRDTTMHRLGVGTARDMHSVLSGVFWPSLRSPQYTPTEKLRLWRGKFTSGVSTLWAENLATDLGQTVTELAIPLYLLHGIHDYTCSYPLAQEYFEKVQAPLKGFYTFHRSAHSPLFEEPERAQAILRDDVLGGTTSLADRT